MNTPVALARLRQKAFALGSSLARLPGHFLGSVSWRPPFWLSAAGESWRGVERRYPRLIAPAIIGLFLVCCAGAWTWHWYAHLPKPHRVTAKIEPIPVTKLEKDLKFPALIVRFSEPAARLEDLHKPSVQGVKLEPNAGGTWYWSASDRLVFRPDQDWPADQKVRVLFGQNFFPRHIIMERLAYETRTPAFGVAVKQPELSWDPATPRQRQVTATVELTHPVEPGELERHLQLSMVGGSAVWAPNDKAPHFTISYGLHRRLAYVRSSFINLPERDDFMNVTVSKGVRPAQGAGVTRDIAEAKLRIPSLSSMFRIDSVQATIARNKAGEPEQVLIVSTTADISTRDLAKALEIRLLPKKQFRPGGTEPDSEELVEDGSDSTTEEEQSTTEETDDENYDASADVGQLTLKDDEVWFSAADVDKWALDVARPVSFVPLPSEKNYDRQHAFRIRIENDGELYVRINHGVRAIGDYALIDDHNAVIRVPAMPREVQIESEGGLLALNGERKLSVRSRGLNALEFEIARVATSQINHLVSQTEGKFQHPEFAHPYLFNQENISRIGTARQGIALENKWKANYSAFDFTEHLRKPSDGGSERGLFFLTARAYDPIKKKSIKSLRDSRFVLVTDIGILTKKNADGSSDVFLMSIKEGKPLPNVTVDLLGKNGIPLASSKSDGDGHCAFASVDKLSRDRTPIAYVARNGDDISFIAYASRDRGLNFSRFNVDGVDSVLAENLDAFVFTERGVYRPGDEIHVGIVVKQRNWAGQLKGLPIEIEVRDARGNCVREKQLTLPEAAFAEFNYTTASESPTGVYQFNVYLTKSHHRNALLGSATANVKEFLPDRLRIQSRLSQQLTPGWINPKAMGASIGLANLYGTPATDRRIVAKLELTPSRFRFPEFNDYVFFDPLSETNEERHVQTVELGEQKTDEAGQTEFALGLERFAEATYSMRFIAEGFEAEGGRSVTTTTDALVSTLPYVVGCKPDGNLRYVELNKARTLDLVAVDPQLKRIAIENVTANIVAQEYVSVLAKQENGNYAYQSVLKERLTKSEKISVSASGSRYALPANEPGNYIFELRDDQDRRLTKVQFSVVGHGTGNGSLERNSELQVKLDRIQYNSGDDIAVSINAPYAGSGLITIERDHVYAQQWFQATTASSEQHIRVPPNFEGSGYINVAFVRALDSKEIFVSPLSYGVVPFTANLEKRRLNIQIDAPGKARPGESLHIAYKTDRASRIAIFAVDEGILQVTNFKTPDPLEFFFRKCALRVETAQIVDLIIPEFSVLRSVSAYGGGGDIQRLNPFKRVTDKPVVFWLGIIEAGPQQREVIYDVPDYFDGTLKIMAVAVADDSVGSIERETLVRGPFIITPSVPVFAAPGDEFEAGLTVANNVEGSGSDAEVSVAVTTNDKLSLLEPLPGQLIVPEGRERSLVFRFRTTERLGSGEVTFTARGSGQETKRRATLSVRPAVPYMTEVHSGNFSGSNSNAPVTRDMHAEFRKLNATLSTLPIGLAHGLDAYLKGFPHGCSEQITSGAFCRLMLLDQPEFGLTKSEIAKQLEYTFGVLQRRQNDQGRFGYWVPEPGDQISFVTVYVMDFLSEAKAAGFAPPSVMFDSGLRHLQKMVSAQPHDLTEARTVAYAIYILTREGAVTTNYILNLQDYLNKNQRNQWQNDLTGVYLAGALHLLHKDRDAESLIAQYKLDKTASGAFQDDFCQPLANDSQYLAVLAREFPPRLRKLSADQFQKIVQPIGEGYFNTLSAAYAVRALKAYSEVIGRDLPQLTISEVRRDKTEVRLASTNKFMLASDFSPGATSVRFNVGGRLSGPGAFFQVIQAGFDRQAPQKPVAQGLEIYRELLGKNNVAATATQLGEQLRVRLHVRSLQRRMITNVAIVDLLPGGFEVLDSTARTGACPGRGIDYVDVREDRVVFFAAIPVQGLDIDYTNQIM